MPINKFLYFGDFVAIPVAVAVFFGLALHGAGVGGLPAYLTALVGGGVFWTLAEYWIHRTLYHHAPVLSPLHDAHHRAPNAFIGVPSFVSSGIVILVSYTPIFLFAPIAADGFTSGVLVGYASYMVVHHATHHWALQPGDWLYGARVRHLAHHYHDDANFGVVTGFWDRVFGTTGMRRDRYAGA